MIYTEEQIARANETDLASFLNAQGERLIKSGREYRWQAHDSLTVRKNKWFRHSSSRGGYPIDFVMEFYGKTFTESVKMLTGEEPAGESGSAQAVWKGKKKKADASGNCGSEKAGTADPAGISEEHAGDLQEQQFRLPVPNDGNGKVIRYLTEERKVDEEISAFFISKGMIYEDAEHHNAVFVGRDGNGIPRYAAVRGTEEKFRMDIAGSDKSYGFSYQGRGDQLFVFEAPIDMLSFISLYRKDWKERNYVSLGGISEKAILRILRERKDIRKVFLCLDSDEAGQEGCNRIAEILPDSLSVTQLIPVAKDWNDVLRGKENFPNRKYIAETRVLKEPPVVKMIRMSEVRPETVEWLWYPYIPFGKLTILQGNPGEGKTYFAMELAAACTTGKALPDMEPVGPLNVIYQTAEDGLGDTIRPRLQAAGADLDRVLVIDDTEDPLTLSDERIEKAIVENHARLMVIDPLQAFVGASVDMNRANEVRPVFRALGDIAQRTGCAILLIGHLNKAAGVQSTYRGLGSIDITAVVRSLLFIGKVKGNEDLRVLTHEKSSLAPAGISLSFSISDDKGFIWEGPYDITSDELLSGKETSEENQTKTEKAEKLILKMLEDGKKVYVSEIEDVAKVQAISPRTVRLAKAKLGAKVITEIQPDRRKMLFLSE